MSLFRPTWHTEEKVWANTLTIEPGKPGKAFSGLTGEASKAVCPRFSPAHPCIGCSAETEPEDVFCPRCWEMRLARMPLDVAERRRRLDRARRERRAERLATSPRVATSSARSIPSQTSPDGSAA
jgi:hypothetical protein